MQNFNETVKQWAGVLGYTYGSPQQTLAGNPSSAYTKYVYGPNLVAVYGTGVTHDVPVNGDQDMAWFGITGSDAPAPTNPTTTTLVTSTKASTTAVATTTAPPAGGCVAAQWAQCGGQGWTGCTACASPAVCKFSNNWYSQCL